MNRKKRSRITTKYECNVGLSCGFACIDATEQCRIAHTAQEKQVFGAIVGGGGAVSETSKVKTSSLTDEEAVEMSRMRRMASGTFGIVLSQDKDTVVKVGYLAPNEIEIQNKAYEAGLNVPRVISASRGDHAEGFVNTVWDKHGVDRDATVARDNTMIDFYGVKPGVFQMERKNAREYEEVPSDSETLSLISQIRKLHQLGYVHNDLHWGNVQQSLADGKPTGSTTLFDFGLSKQHKDDDNLIESETNWVANNFVQPGDRTKIQEHPDMQALWKIYEPEVFGTTKKQALKEWRTK